MARKKKSKNNGSLMGDAKDTMALGIGSMAGMGAMGAMGNIPGMPAAATGIQTTVGAGKTYA